MKKPKTKKQLIEDPRVLEYWYEEGEDRCHWVSLKDGYNWNGCCQLNGSTIHDLLESFEEVKVGDIY